MKRVTDDNTGLWLKDAVEGQFQVIEKDDYKELVLCDNQRNTYAMHTVSILSAQFSRYEGSMEIPKPYRVKPDGTIIETGAKVLIIFPMGRTRPFVVGCVNRLGGQNRNAPALQVDADNMRRKKSRSINDDTSFERIEDNDGVQEIVNGGSYTIVTNGGNVTVHSDTKMSLEGKKQIDVLGDIVEIGGNTNRVPNDPDDNQKNKAETISLYGNKVVIGHSDHRGQEIKVDKPRTIDEPVMQPLVMGITLETLLDILVDILQNAKYTGSGVIMMMPSSVLELRRRIREKLPKIKSKVGFVLYDPKQVKGQRQ